MEIRSLRKTGIDGDIVKCELIVGGVTKKIRQQAVDLSGYDFPKLYLDMTYNKETKITCLVIYEKDGKTYSLYTRGKSGRIYPIEYRVTPKTINELSKIVSAYAK